jgi:hypothetical protein
MIQMCKMCQKWESGHVFVDALGAYARVSTPINSCHFDATLHQHQR